MSLQWTCVAGFLYAEIIIVALLLMPFISPKMQVQSPELNEDDRVLDWFNGRARWLDTFACASRPEKTRRGTRSPPLHIYIYGVRLTELRQKRWANLFNSRFLKSFAAQANIWFTVAIGILLLFFVDSVRDVVKYSSIRYHDEDHHHHHAHMDIEIQHQMKMFRSQRNFYIAGFSLFLALVIRRLAFLITSQARLIASNDALTKQAQNAAKAAEAVLDSQTAAATNTENDQKELLKQLEVKEKELVKAVKDKEAMKDQSLNLQKQYEELCKEHSHCAAPSSNKKLS